MSGFRVVIPARLGSTRLPRKVLRLIDGKPLVQYVWQAARASGADEVVIATDSVEVLEVCRGFGAEVRMTRAEHGSGTDRVHQVAVDSGWRDDAVIVNLQGDEPLMPPALIREVAGLLVQDPAADIASLCHPLTAAEDFTNPNVVKLVMDARGYALYFSRAPIPWPRDTSRADHAALPTGLAHRHIGLYAYRVGALARFSALPPANLEQCEALEQLRALANGLRIRMGVTPQAPPRGVDTEEDLRVVTRYLTDQASATTA